MFKKILCPIDFSKESYVALAKSIEVAYYNSRSEVLILHATAPSTNSALSTNMPQEKQAALATLLALFNNRVPSHIQLTTISKPGLLSEQLVQIAQEEQIDLLVLSSHLVMTSHLDGVETAESLQQAVSKILNTTLCSILSVGKTIEHTATGCNYGYGATSGYALSYPTLVHEKVFSTSFCTPAR